jgi:hypothetical protein
MLRRLVLVAQLLYLPTICTKQDQDQTERSLFRAILTWNIAARASMSPHGLLPAHISSTTQPKLQISTLAEYPCPLTE